MNRLESRLEEAVNEFNDKSLSEILDDTYAVAGSSKAVTVRKNLIKNALKKIGLPAFCEVFLVFPCSGSN